MPVSIWKDTFNNKQYFLAYEKNSYISLLCPS